MTRNIETDTDGTMRDIADFIKEKTLGKYAFLAMVFEFNKSPATSNYISNARRADMVKALREKADILEQKLDICRTEDES